MELFEKHRRKIIVSILFAVVVYAVLLLVSDTSKLVVEVKDFRWELLPIVISLTLFNYAIRFGKWHYYLGVVGVKNLQENFSRRFWSSNASTRPLRPRRLSFLRSA
jgi:hypothetical protein